MARPLMKLLNYRTSRNWIAIPLSLQDVTYGTRTGKPAAYLAAWFTGTLTEEISDRVGFDLLDLRVFQLSIEHVQLDQVLAAEENRSSQTQQSLLVLHETRHFLNTAISLSATHVDQQNETWTTVFIHVVTNLLFDKQSYNF